MELTGKRIANDRKSMTDPRSRSQRGSLCGEIRPFWPARSLWFNGPRYPWVKARDHADRLADVLLVLWRTSGSCENYGLLSGHKGAVLDLHWSRDSRVIYSASADMHLASWDLESGQRIRKHPGHEEVINCMDVSKRGEEFLISGSDDGYIGVGLETEP